MLNYILIASVTLPLLGLLRTSIEGNKPKYLYDIQSVLKKWQSENNWAARFSLFFAIFLFAYNLLAWGVYGFTSIFEFIAFLFKKIWWVLLWIWNEVLHPTVFSFFKLLWHYVVVMAWKFFKFTISLFPENFKKKNIIFSFKKLLVFTMISIAVLIVYFLTKHIIALVLALLVVFYLFQYTVFLSISFFRANQYPKEDIRISLKISLLWLTMSAASTALLLALKNFHDMPIITGLNVALIQVLFPLAVIFGIAFLATSFYLPAFLAERDKDKELDVLDFLKALICRFPKILASRPFKLGSMLVLSILPVLIFYVMNVAMKEFSLQSIRNWTIYAVNMQEHIPSTIHNGERIKMIKLKKDTLVLEKDSLELMYDDYITATISEKNQVLALKNQIQDKKIHTLKRAIYVGENQSFSMPNLIDCAEVEWLITRPMTNNVVKRESVSMKDSIASILLYHQWNAPGVYRVALRSKPSCSVRINEVIEVEVVAKPDDVQLDALVDDFIVSREAADYALDRLDIQLEEFQKDKAEVLKGIDDMDNQYAQNIKSFKKNSAKHILWLFTKIIVLFSLGFLFAGLISLVWTYCLLFEFDIYSFEQAEKHYYQKELARLRAINPNQPLLGIFVILPFILLLLLYMFADNIASDIDLMIRRYF